MAVAKKKVVKKKPARKTTVKKKVVARKPAAKKRTVKKAAPKKKTVKKAAPKKKAAARKAPAKKKTVKKATTRKAAPRKTTRAKAKPKAKVKRKPNAAFMRPMTLSEALGAVVGNKAIPRTEVTKKLWLYIKKNKLQDSINRRMINADAKLKKVFGGKRKVSMFEMTKLVSKHMK